MLMELLHVPLQFSVFLDAAAAAAASDSPTCQYPPVGSEFFVV